MPGRLNRQWAVYEVVGGASRLHTQRAVSRLDAETHALGHMSAVNHGSEGVTSAGPPPEKREKRKSRKSKKKAKKHGKRRR